MKFTKRMTVNAAFISIALLVSLLTGCGSKSGSLLNNIPEDATTVAVVDLDAILKNAGCRIDNGVITLSPDLEQLTSRMNPKQADMLEAVTKAAPAVNLDEVGVFSIDNYAGIALSLKAPELFEQGVKAGAKETVSAAGQDVYVYDDIAIAIDGNYAWLTVNAVQMENVLNSLAKGNFGSKYPVLSENLADKGNALRIVSQVAENFAADPYNGVAQKFDRLFMVGKLKITDSVLDFEASFTDRDNKPLNFSPYFAETGTDFLRFVDPGSNVVIAIGKPESQEMIQQVIAIFGRQFRDINSLLPMLKAVNGTTSASYRLTSDINLNDSPDWLNAGEYILTTQIEGSESQSLMQMVQLAGGTKLEETPAGAEVVQYELKAMGTPYYIGLFQGTVAAGNRPISDTFSNSFTTDFQGARAGYVLTFAPGSPLSKALDIPYGAYSSLIVKEQTINCKLRFNGSSRNVVATLINLLATKNLVKIQ